LYHQLNAPKKDDKRYEDIQDDGIPSRVLLGRCYAAVNRGINATIVALFDPKQMSEGANITRVEDYKRYVYTSRRKWWNPVYTLAHPSGKMKRALTLVIRDIQGIIGKKLV
jgi:hypothetical protein